VRMAWGSAQEPAATHSLVQLFPESAVGEVGASCWLSITLHLVSVAKVMCVLV